MPRGLATTARPTGLRVGANCSSEMACVWVSQLSAIVFRSTPNKHHVQHPWLGRRTVWPRQRCRVDPEGVGLSSPHPTDDIHAFAENHPQARRLGHRAVLPTQLARLAYASRPKALFSGATPSIGTRSTLAIVGQVFAEHREQRHRLNPRHLFRRQIGRVKKEPLLMSRRDVVTRAWPHCLTRRRLQGQAQEGVSPSFVRCHPSCSKDAKCNVVG